MESYVNFTFIYLEPFMLFNVQNSIFLISQPLHRIFTTKSLHKIDSISRYFETFEVVTYWYRSKFLLCDLSRELQLLESSQYDVVDFHWIRSREGRPSETIIRAINKVEQRGSLEVQGGINEQMVATYWTNLSGDL